MKLALDQVSQLTKCPVFGGYLLTGPTLQLPVKEIMSW